MAYGIYMYYKVEDIWYMVYSIEYMTVSANLGSL